MSPPLRSLWMASQQVAVLLLLFVGISVVQSDIISYIKIKKLLTAMAVAKVMTGGKRPTIIPIPIPIPLPIQSNDFIRLPMHASKTFISGGFGDSGHLGGIGHSIHGGGYGSSKGEGLSGLAGGLSGLTGGLSGMTGGLGLFGNSLHGGGGHIGSRFGIGGMGCNFCGMKGMNTHDWNFDAYSSGPYRESRKKRRRRPFRGGSRRIRSKRPPYDGPINRGPWTQIPKEHNLSPSASAAIGTNIQNNNRPTPLPIGDVFG